MLLLIAVSLPLLLLGCLVLAKLSQGKPMFVSVGLAFDFLQVIACPQIIGTHIRPHVLQVVACCAQFDLSWSSTVLVGFERATPLALLSLSPLPGDADDDFMIKQRITMALPVACSLCFGLLAVLRATIVRCMHFIMTRLKCLLII